MRRSIMMVRAFIRTHLRIGRLPYSSLNSCLLTGSPTPRSEMHVCLASNLSNMVGLGAAEAGTVIATATTAARPMTLRTAFFLM
jgi:hypothetical protein